MPTKFQEKVYSIVKKVRKGKITTYKEIAIKLDSGPRAVGQALKRNTCKSVPCHRVIQADGRIGGYRGKKNNRNKIKLLKAEGIKISRGKLNKKNDTPTYSYNCRACRPWKNFFTG